MVEHLVKEHFGAVIEEQPIPSAVPLGNLRTADSDEPNWQEDVLNLSDEDTESESAPCET